MVRWLKKSVIKTGCGTEINWQDLPIFYWSRLGMQLYYFSKQNCHLVFFSSLALKVKSLWNVDRNARPHYEWQSACNLMCISWEKLDWWRWLFLGLGSRCSVTVRPRGSGPGLGATSTRLGRARGAGSWLVWLPVSWLLELQTNLREVWSWIITKKAPTRAFSWLKVEWVRL